MGVLSDNPIKDFPIWEQAGFKRFGFTCWRKFIATNIELLIDTNPGFIPHAMFFKYPGHRMIYTYKFSKGSGFDEIRDEIKVMYDIDICVNDGHIPQSSLLNTQIQAAGLS